MDISPFITGSVIPMSIEQLSGERTFVTIAVPMSRSVKCRILSGEHR